MSNPATQSTSPNPAPNPTANQQAWLNRLAFQCKRGNLETELLLAAYLPQLEQQPIEQQQLFEQLLQESDQSLFYWLLPQQLAASPKPGNQLIPDKYRRLIAEIRDNYLNSSR